MTSKASSSRHVEALRLDRAEDDRHGLVVGHHDLGAGAGPVDVLAGQGGEALLAEVAERGHDQRPAPRRR